MTPTRDTRPDTGPLIAVSLLMAALTVVFGVAMLVDPRTIEGVPAWLKPTKFAVSTAIYGGTLAWVLGALADWPRVRRWAVWMTAAVFVGEVALIAMQAWRGTTSHFNTSTPFDAAVFAIMGTGILAQTVTAAAVAVALWRQPFTDRAAGWAMRLGMTLSVVGALTGALMTRPTAEQLAAGRITGAMPRCGAHAVGAPDGGPGLRRSRDGPCFWRLRSMSPGCGGCAVCAGAAPPGARANCAMFWRSAPRRGRRRRWLRSVAGSRGGD